MASRLHVRARLHVRTDALNSRPMLRNATALAIILALGACGSDSGPAVQQAEQASKRSTLQEAADREEGFAWAKKRDLADPAVCGNDRPAFVEGCETWVSLELQGPAINGAEEKQ
jgi:hypothetical protein